MCACIFRGPPSNPMLVKSCAAHTEWRAQYARNVIRAMGAEHDVPADVIEAALNIVDDDLNRITEPHRARS